MTALRSRYSSRYFHTVKVLCKVEINIRQLLPFSPKERASDTIYDAVECNLLCKQLYSTTGRSLWQRWRGDIRFLILCFCLLPYVVPGTTPKGCELTALQHVLATLPAIRDLGVKALVCSGGAGVCSSVLLWAIAQPLVCTVGLCLGILVSRFPESVLWIATVRYGAAFASSTERCKERWGEPPESEPVMTTDLSFAVIHSPSAAGRNNRLDWTCVLFFL